MKKVFSLLFIAFLSTSIFAQTTWQADKAHSQVSFAINHLGISEIEGLFRDFDISIVASEEDFSDAKYNVVIYVNSIDTGVERRDNHLKSADFFEVEKFPKMTFVSNSTKKVSDGKYKVTGDLTLHGVTKPVTLDAWHRGTITQKNDTKVAGFQVTGTINRSDFNIGGGFTEPTLSDEVKIKVDAEFKK